MTQCNDVECFMYYMYNKWCLEESISLFGENLGKHIFNKWCDLSNTSDQTMLWYGELDKVCRNKVYERALSVYKQ